MSIGSDELELYSDNEYDLYKQKMAVAKTVATHKARGNYRKDQAHKAFLLYLANPAAKKYAKVHGGPGDSWNVMFTKQDREDFAKSHVEWFEESWKEGEFESIIPKKYQKAATKKKAQAAFVLAAKGRK